VVERHLDLVLGVVELVEGAVPGVELARMDADPAAAVPVGDEAATLAIADEVGLEPSGEAVFAGRSDEPIGDKHEGAVGERDGFGPSEVFVEEIPKAQLIEQGEDDKDRSPVRGVSDLWFGVIGSLAVGLACQEFAELGKDLDEEILATEIGDDALFDLTVFSVGLDDADVFVDGAA
jgi:hypothetical protein